MKNKQITWFMLALLGALLSAPNALMLKNATDSIDPYMVNVLRFGIVAVFCLPFVYAYRKHIKLTQVKDTLLAGVALAIAVLSFTKAIEMSEASYVSVVVLLLPVFLVLYSLRIYKEKLSKKSVMGITLAFLGVALIVAIPYIFGTRGMTFYPEATLVALLDCIFYPFVFIYLRKANQAGMPMIVTIGLSAMVTTLLSFVAHALWGADQIVFSKTSFYSIVYSAFGVAILARMLRVWTYERIGVALTSSLTYLDTFVGIVLPIVFLGETLSPSVWAGGAIILSGVLLVESQNLKWAHKRLVKVSAREMKKVKRRLIPIKI